jgi:hypothetical protein
MSIGYELWQQLAISSHDRGTGEENAKRQAAVGQACARPVLPRDKHRKRNREVRAGRGHEGDNLVLVGGRS